MTDFRDPHFISDVKTLDYAKRQFVEIWGGPLVLNTWLTAACGFLVVLVIVLTVALVHASNRLASLKPIVVRIDDVGRAEAVTYDAATWKPQTQELRYFLTRFVVLHYGRQRATIARDYPDSLLFLDSQLTNAILAGGHGKGAVETFVEQPAADEVDVEVRNVTFSNLNTPPYQASVDFSTHSFTPNTRQAQKTETFTAQVAFTLRDAVPNAYVPVNPLGLQITQLRVDQAFY